MVVHVEPDEPYRLVQDLPCRMDYLYGVKKPPRRETWRRLPANKLYSHREFCKVIVSVWPEDCQGVVEDDHGDPLDIVEVSQPGLTYHLLYAYCRHEKHIPLETQMLLWKMPARREKIARRWHAWFLDKFGRRWMRDAA